MESKIRPTPTQKRIDGIDILRGFALLGILLVASFKPVARALKPMALMDRMSLTNYLA